MTTRYYSPSKGSFYTDDPNAGPVPSDCFKVSTKHFSELMLAQEQGQEIVYVEGELTAKAPGITMATIRAARDSKLRRTDWSQGLDVPEAVRTAWTTYRQALRDIPQTFDGSPGEVVWPTPPTM